MIKNPKEKSLLIPIVDENDCTVGFDTKEKIHQKGLLHRAFSIFVYRLTSQDVEFLLQKRNRVKYHSGGLWTNTCCSHPYWEKFTLEENAKRRMKEEVGFTCPLQKVGSFRYRAVLENGLIEHEIDHVFIGNYMQRTGDFYPDPQEIEDSQWLTVGEISKKLEHFPESFTAWFKKAFTIAKDELLRVKT